MGARLMAVLGAAMIWLASLTILPMAVKLAGLEGVVPFGMIFGWSLFVFAWALESLWRRRSA